MATASAGPTPTTVMTEMVLLAQIRRWDKNPRQSFEKDKLEELTASVRQDGVLEPILLRPAALDKAGARFEIVAGERRFRAAGQAGLAAIPAIVRPVSDAKALELALAENMQREALSPLEEADGFTRLMRDHRYSIDDIALKMGKSRSFVFQRLKLAGLPPGAKKALAEGRIPPSVAILIARIPHPKMQEEATRERPSRRRI